MVVATVFAVNLYWWQLHLFKCCSVSRQLHKTQ